MEEDKAKTAKKTEKRKKKKVKKDQAKTAQKYHLPDETGHENSQTDIGGEDSPD